MRKLPFVDLPTFLRLSVEGEFAFVPRVVGYWRQRMDSGTRTRNQMEAARAMIDLAIDFLGEHGNRLEIPPMSEPAIVSHHLHRAQELRINAGRRLLLRNEWARARQSFVQALFSRNTSRLTRIHALAGIVFSWIRMDVEWVVRLLKGRDVDMRWIFSIEAADERG